MALTTRQMKEQTPDHSRLHAVLRQSPIFTKRHPVARQLELPARVSAFIPSSAQASSFPCISVPRRDTDT